MPRPRKASDEKILEAALALMEERGSDAITFALLAERTGLSGSTLVQRFGTKQALVAAALVHAWDALDARTRAFAEEEPRTAEGAIAILTRLSNDYGDIDSYADKLHLLREDLRNAEYRARGKAWVTALAEHIEARFPPGPRVTGTLGMTMIAQWQGALLLWAFSPDVPLVVFVRARLEAFVGTLGLAHGGESPVAREAAPVSPRARASRGSTPPPRPSRGKPAR